MSEESTLTKNETEKNMTVNTVIDTNAVAAAADTDASNIVPFSSESPAPPAAEPKADAEVLKSPERAPDILPVKEAAPTSSAQVSDIHTNAASPIRTAEPSADTASPYSEKGSRLFNKASEFTGKASEYGEAISDYTDKAAEFAGKTFKKAASRIKSEEAEDFADEETAPKRRFHFKKDDKEFFRDKWILSRISDEQLMNYLTLEQRRNELQQQARESKEKRIFRAFQLTAALASIVAVIYLLRDNPTILVNILYIAGILTAFWFWKNPRDKQ